MLMKWRKQEGRPDTDAGPCKAAAADVTIARVKFLPLLTQDETALADKAFRHEPRCLTDTTTITPEMFLLPNPCCQSHSRATNQKGEKLRVCCQEMAVLLDLTPAILSSHVQASKR
jgi:hypothetical protein